MSDDQNPKRSNLSLIRDFFEIKGATELKDLIPEDREQLGRGIEDGSLNY